MAGEAERKTFEELEADEIAARETETTPADPQEEPSEEDKAWEERAYKQGWRPLAEWRGDPAKWRSAREFVERGENNQPILIERLRTLETRFDQQGRQLTEANNKLKESTEVMGALYKWAQKADERAYERAVAEQQQRQRAAVADANTAEYDAATAALSNLEAGRGDVLPKEPPKPTAPEPAAAPTPDKDPVIEAWVNQNAAWWNDSDTELKDTAIALYSTLTVSKPDWSTQTKLDEILKRIKKMAPEKFANPRRSAPSSVSEPSGAPAGGRRSAAFSFADLPKEEQKQCDRFVAQIPGFTREAYVKEYVRNYGDGK